MLYSPGGITKTVSDIAERLKGAIEAKAIERNQGEPLAAGTIPGEFSNGTLSYNVFVVTGAFRATDYTLGLTIAFIFAH